MNQFQNILNQEQIRQLAFVPLVERADRLIFQQLLF
jgi:hypothetical protein